MTVHDPIIKPFVPGTTGWRASDLDEPEIEKLWMSGRYEIVEGVLATMAAAYFEGSASLHKLIKIVELYFDRVGVKGTFGTEVDLVLNDQRVAVADAAFLTDDDMARQRAARAHAPKADLEYGRILVPPTLLIESISIGHETHDRKLKRAWYAQWGVPNYWVLDAFANSLECFRLEGQAYVVDQTGRGKDTVRPPAFAGLEISLQQIWI